MREGGHGGETGERGGTTQPLAVLLSPGYSFLFAGAAAAEAGGAPVQGSNLKDFPGPPPAAVTLRWPPWRSSSLPRWEAGFRGCTAADGFPPSLLLAGNSRCCLSLEDDDDEDDFSLRWERV